MFVFLKTKRSIVYKLELFGSVLFGVAQSVCQKQVHRCNSHLCRETR